MAGITSVTSFEYHGDSEAIFSPLRLASSLPDSPAGVFFVHDANGSDIDITTKAATAFLTEVFILFSPLTPYIYNLLLSKMAARKLSSHNFSCQFESVSLFRLIPSGLCPEQSLQLPQDSSVL